MRGLWVSRSECTSIASFNSQRLQDHRVTSCEPGIGAAVQQARTVNSLLLDHKLQFTREHAIIG